MSNQIFGIITVVICSIGYFFSWKYNVKGNYKIALALLLICGLLLRIYISTDLFLHAWDERYHALVAKNLIKHLLIPTLYDNPVLHYHIESWTTNHIWLHKQPLPLWTMSVSMMMFGVNELALRLPSIILSTIGIGLTFSIGSFFFNKKVGYVAALLFSLNGLILEITGGRVATDHIDLFFLFFIELAVFFSIRFVETRKNWFTALTGFSIGLAILSKWLPAFIVFPIWFLIVLDSEKFGRREILIQLSLLIGVCLFTFLPWQLYIHSCFPQEAEWEAGFNVKHLTEVLDEQGGPFYYFIDRIRINYGELIYLPFVWFFWKIYSDPKNFKHLALCVWFVIPILFFSVVKTKMQAYVLFTSPALFIVTAEFWIVLSEYKKTSKFKWFYSLVLILLIALPIRYSIERMKPFSQMERHPLWVKDLKALATKDFKNGILFNYSRPVEAMFYTDLVVYDYVPDKQTIDNLIAKGYNVAINNNNNSNRIPDEIKSMNSVYFLDLTDTEE